MASREFVKIGEYYSADYLRLTDLDSSRTFTTMFKLARENNKLASDADVISNIKMFNRPDVSPVFRVAEMNPQRFYRTALFQNSQTNVIAVPAPGIGKRIVAEAAYIRSAANFGTAFFTSGAITLFYIDFAALNHAEAESLTITLEENQPVLFSSTQGNKSLYVAAQWYVETIRAEN